MNYYIYCNEKSISKAHKDAMNEYIKRLSSYCKISFHASKKNNLPNNITANNHQIIMIKEGPSDFSSEQFANEIKTMEQSGKSNVHIFIGYQEDVLIDTYQSDNMIIKKQSLSNFSISNQMICILFLEQLYRGYTIIQGKTYHK
ncbi:MAG: 23S rRNA (pseudouridine(1915)-N(3))-methyltransferase RlmH [Lachnospiraceae bacterium]